jgi:uncharacterized membrane protein YfcA
MKSRWFVAALFGLPMIAAGTMAWLLWRVRDDGRWLFTVFTVFFLAIAFAPFLSARRRQTNEKHGANTRFASAWVLPLYLTVAGGLLVVAALVGYFHCHGR